MIHNLFPNEVYLEPNEHKYFDSKGNQYISFSALYGKLVKKFDAEGISKLVSKANGKSADEVRQGWEQTAVNGTRIDKALELYAQTATILPEDDDLKELVPHVLSKYKVYNRCFEQGVPYSKKYRVAGSWDKLSLTSNRKDSKFHLSDFKCFEKGYDSLFTVSGQQWLNPPFNHLPNTKFTKISMQLSFYSFLFEELTGRGCEKLFIDLITPVFDETHRLLSYKNETIPTVYLKNDIKIFLETFKEDIKDMLDNTIKAEFVDVSAEDDDIF
jgi:hypothetical protein